MKKEVADKWVEALRSGDYKQTDGGLKINNEFCCLGVLCDISGQGTFEVKYKDKLSTYTDYTFKPFDKKARSDHERLPPKIRNWAGMKSTDGSIQVYINHHTDEVLTPEEYNKLEPELQQEYSRFDTLVDLNDNQFSFVQIADIIEKNWKKL